MSSVSFADFVSKYPNWEKEFEVYQKDSSKYKRIICRWEEHGMHHEVHNTINIKTGEIFLDCSKRTIFKKHLTLIFARPIHTVVKTLWHLSILGPLVSQTVDVINKKGSFKDLLKGSAHSLADIVRTPVYGIAMTITSIAGVIFGCICPSTLYYTRDLAGKLERKMLRVEKKPGLNKWSLNPCFSPLYYLAEKVQLAEKEHLPVQKATNKLAENGVKDKRRHANVFVGCCYKLPSNTTYISPIADGRVHFFGQFSACVETPIWRICLLGNS